MLDNSSNLQRTPTGNAATPKPTTTNHDTVILATGECTWAKQYPAIQKACFMNRVCQYAPPRELRVQMVEPILQHGPTCGLTALSMIFDGAPSASSLLDLAIRRGYSNNGEMFSARQLNDLFGAVLQEHRHLVEYKPVTHTLVGGWMDDPNIQLKLRLGAMFLVPYPFPCVATPTSLSPPVVSTPLHRSFVHKFVLTFP